MLAALGRLAHRRRRLIITLWSALLVLGFTVGVSVFNHLSDSGGVTASGSARDMELLDSGQRHSPASSRSSPPAASTPPATPSRR